MRILPESLNALPGVTAGFSTRSGGVSSAPFDSLNLGLSTGDDPVLVSQNRRTFFDAFGVDPEELAVPGQVHGDQVQVVESPGLYPGRDGLITRRSEVALCIIAADCAAVLIADPEARVIGACHSGWRGTVAGITGKTIAAMRAEGADPSRLHVYVGPSIGPEHFEVGPEVADRFDPRYVHIPGPESRPHVDLKSVIRDQLEEAGVPSGQIELSPHCTYARTDLFFSYRAEGGRTGRMMGFIVMDLPTRRED